MKSKVGKGLYISGLTFPDESQLVPAIGINMAVKRVVETISWEG